MSVSMSIHLPGNSGDEVHQKVFTCWDHIYVDQHYGFMGHIIDMSIRRDSDDSIPEKPLVKVIEMTQDYMVELCMGDHTDKHYPDQNFYFCRAGQFSNIPDSIEASMKNKAILSFLKGLPAGMFVIIKMSW